MCVTPAERSVIVPGACRNCCHIRAKKAAFFTLFYQSKTVSSQFLFLPIYQQEGIWSFEARTYQNHSPIVQEGRCAKLSGFCLMRVHSVLFYPAKKLL